MIGKTRKGFTNDTNDRSSLILLWGGVPCPRRPVERQKPGRKLTHSTAHSEAWNRPKNEIVNGRSAENGSRASCYLLGRAQLVRSMTPRHIVPPGPFAYRRLDGSLARMSKIVHLNARALAHPGGGRGADRRTAYHGTE